MPQLERPPQLAEFIAEALDLKLEVGVARGDVVKVPVFFPFCTVAELQGSTLGLVPGRVGVRRITRKVKTLQRRVPGASLSSEEQPSLFLLRPGINELELSVRYPTILGIHSGRFRSVALADDLDEALAGVDLVAEYLAEIAGFGPEDFLNDRRIPQACKDCGDAVASLNYEKISADNGIFPAQRENFASRAVKFHERFGL